MAVSDQSRKVVQVRDPLYGFIEISEYPVIKDLVDNEYFQRLRRLHQLGLTSIVYPNATHSRFAHSIGVMHVFLILFDSLEKREKISNNDNTDKLREYGAIAALLHDIGHGPFSHISEKILENGKFKHEKLTRDIINKTKIKNILKKHNIDIKRIINILDHAVSDEWKIVSQLISSQLDADRLDYLTRDSLFTGIPYGNVDIYRIANTLTVGNKKSQEFKNTVMVLEKGRQAIEAFILSRHYMYSTVYFHKTIKSAETILSGIFKRAKECNAKSDINEIINAENITPKIMLELDDGIFNSLIHKWSKSSDSILSDLCKRYRNRDLFASKKITVSDYVNNRQELNNLKNVIEKGGFSDHYFSIGTEVDKDSFKPYVPKFADDEKTSFTQIWIKCDNGKIKEISKISRIIESLGTDDISTYMFFPKNMKGKINNKYSKILKRDS